MNPIHVCLHIYMLQYICIYVMYTSTDVPLPRMWPEAMTKLTKALRIHGWHQQTSRSCQPLAAKLRIAYEMPFPIDHHPMHLLGATGNNGTIAFPSASVNPTCHIFSQSRLPRTNLVLGDTNNQFPVDDSGLTGCVVFVHTWNTWAISEVLPRQSKCWVQSIEKCFQQPHTQQLLKRGAMKRSEVPTKTFELATKMPCSDLGGGWTAGLNNQQSELPMLQWSQSRGENESWFETATSFSC